MFHVQMFSHCLVASFLQTCDYWCHYFLKCKLLPRITFTEKPMYSSRQWQSMWKIGSLSHCSLGTIVSRAGKFTRPHSCYISLLTYSLFLSSSLKCEIKFEDMSQQQTRNNTFSQENRSGSLSLRNKLK